MKNGFKDKLAKSLLLYAVTDRHWLGERTLYDVVRESLEGGVTFLQLREKNLDEEHFYEEAVEL
ncbi:MAG: thiamine phosphate synthase, partial [Butyrivibrio sp.]|nr:thiamine phosphate synthase [Butyrivibrio sp.]